ncbi:MAG: hypothetical protein WC208_14080 [Gallionella sp.]|jgi:hypothetical protein
MIFKSHKSFEKRVAEAVIVERVKLNEALARAKKFCEGGKHDLTIEVIDRLETNNTAPATRWADIYKVCKKCDYISKESR